MWFFYAIIFALLSSFGTVIAKKILGKADVYLGLWLHNLFTIPFLLVIILIFYRIPRIDQSFSFSVVCSVGLDVVAALLAYKALKMSEISLVNPISSFNPVFTAIISYFVLGEKIPFKGCLGIVLIVLGAYLLQFKEVKYGFFAPFKALLTHQGVRYSLIAYFIWAITPIFQKNAILHTTPQVPPFVSFAGLIGTTLVYTPLVKKYSRNVFPIAKLFFGLLLLGGLLSGLAQVGAFMAFSLANLGFATAVFKLSMIFTVLWGALFFKEKNLKERLLGSVVMLFGVVLLVL